MGGRGDNSGYLYVGCFVSDVMLSRIRCHVGEEKLAVEPSAPHITLDFTPSEADVGLFGCNVDFEVLAYANDGTNEGVLVKPVNATEELRPLLALKTSHHITLSISEHGRARDTAALDFKSIEPFRISTTLGGCTFDGRIVIAPQL